MKRTVAQLGLVTLLAARWRAAGEPGGIPPETLVTTDWHFVVRYE